MFKPKRSQTLQINYCYTFSRNLKKSHQAYVSFLIHYHDRDSAYVSPVHLHTNAPHPTTSVFSVTVLLQHPQISFFHRMELALHLPPVIVPVQHSFDYPIRSVVQFSLSPLLSTNQPSPIVIS